MDTFLVLSLVVSNGKKEKLTFVGCFTHMDDLQVCCHEDLVYVITGIQNGEAVKILYKAPSLTDDDEG